MKTSDAGIRFIQSFEKCRLELYDDQADRHTIGWGHLILDGEDFGDSITQEKANQLFADDLRIKAENPVIGCIHIVMEQNQFDAMVSLCFNIGSGNFSKSTLVKKFNMKDFPGCADEFEKWDKAGGEVSNGLHVRRSAEKDIFEQGVYNNHS